MNCTMKDLALFVVVLFEIFVQITDSVNAQDFIAGADISHVAWIENTDMKYMINGKVNDPMTILNLHKVQNRDRRGVGLPKMPKSDKLPHGAKDYGDLFD